MTERKRILVVSDFHMGAGPVLADGRQNYLEDFFHDQKFFLGHANVDPGAHANNRVWFFDIPFARYKVTYCF